MDLAPDLTTKTGGEKLSLAIAVDDFSGFVVLGAMDRKSSTIANWCANHILNIFGTPLYIRTD